MKRSLSRTSVSFFALLVVVILCTAGIALQSVYQVSAIDSAIHINEPSAKIDDRREIVLFRVKNTIKLQEEFKEAALNSVTLPFVFDFRLENPNDRQWFRNALLAADSQHISVRYNTLLERFVLTRTLASDSEFTQVENFPDLNSAMSFLLTANTYALQLQEPLPEAATTTLLLKVRLRLDVDSLPSPLQPYAYASNGWGLDSDWVDWSVRI